MSFVVVVAAVVAVDDALAGVGVDSVAALAVVFTAIVVVVVAAVKNNSGGVVLAN